MAATNGFTGNTRKVTAHLTQNEGLSFEKSSPGKKGYKLAPLDVPEVDPAALLGEAASVAQRGVARAERDRNHPPLHAPLDVELRHRPRHVSAGQLHHEVQPARQRIGLAPGRHRRSASLSAGVAVAGRARNREAAAGMPDRDHRHGRDHAAAGRRRAWRVHRHPAGPRVPRVARAIRARRS